ncbi:MAG: T9SS type A sorting domain-containing protein [Bacteroidetes bacterium]|nr:T9SS type A sorting domain-containing protein [Bacteroidota bacterium]
MKKLLITFVLLVVSIPAVLSAQTYGADTLFIPPDAAGTIGAINTAIQGDTTTDGKDYNHHVFVLQRGSTYYLNGWLTVKAGTHIEIMGQPKPASGTDYGPASIVEGTVTGLYYNYTIDAFGDFTMKNVWMLYATDLGTKNWTDLQFETDSLKTTGGPVGVFDDDIFDWATGIAVTANCAHFTGIFSNCIFRNCIDPTQWWAGRAFCELNANASVDSIAYTNCTLENMGFGDQDDYTPPAASFFNHDTFVNIAKFAFKYYWFTNLVIANSIFVNCHFTGERYADRLGQDPNQLLYGAVVDCDTIPDTLTYNGVNAQNEATKRIFLFVNNSNFTDPMFQAFYNKYNDTVANKIRGVILGEPMMNARTLDMFTWHKLFKMKNVYDSTDPGFIVPPTNRDSIIAFLQARYVSGVNVDWSYPSSDSELSFLWPLRENLAYTNATLLSAGTGGYPIGDLYHWFPDKYTTWKSQEASETQAIYNTITSVKRVGNDVPQSYSLDQNYPNPFNPTTEICYTVPKNGFVTLKVYNVLGQEVATLFSGVAHAGTYEASFDGSRYSSGVYFYRLEAGNVKFVKKMVLMK